MRRRIRMVDLAREVCDGSLVGKRIAVLGAAFKPDSDDIRDSPALNVAAQLQLQGAVVRVDRPRRDREQPRRLWPQLDYADTAEEAAERADAVLVLTEWQEYRSSTRSRSASIVAQAQPARRPQRARPRGRGRRPAGATARGCRGGRYAAFTRVAAVRLQCGPYFSARAPALARLKRFASWRRRCCTIPYPDCGAGLD